MSHKRVKPEVKEDISPNLIPMIDIMFLLLLFFMLGADMGKKEHEQLILPSADKVKEDDNKRNPERSTTINIHHKDDVGPCALAANGGVCREANHWGWAIRGKQYDMTTLKQQLELEAAEAGYENEPGVKKQLSKLKVLIRADATAPYGDIQHVIEKCGEAGIYKIEVGAAKPAAEPKK